MVAEVKTGSSSSSEHVGAGKAAHIIERVIHPTSRILSATAAVCLLILVLLITADVMMRYFFNRPIKGGFELAQLLVIVGVFLAIAFAQVKKRHVSVELLTKFLPQRVQVVLACFTSLLSLAVMLWLTWGCIRMAYNLWHSHTVSVMLQIPIGPFDFIMAFGFMLTGLVLLGEVFKWLHEITRR